MQQSAEVDALLLPMIRSLNSIQTVGASDHFLNGAEAEAGHNFAQILRDESHKVNDMLRIASKVLAQIRILCCDADRTGVHLTDPHHDATYSHQRRCGESELFGAQQRGYGQIAAAQHFAVGFQDDPVAQIVQHQRLMRFGKTQFPRKAGMADGVHWRRACSSIVSADQDNVGTAFCHTCGNRSDTNLGYQLHVDIRARVGVLQVVNQLRQILDGINVMVRRRRDQTHARR